jgi:hypothetical protein
MPCIPLLGKRVAVSRCKLDALCADNYLGGQHSPSIQPRGSAQAGQQRGHNQRVKHYTIRKDVPWHYGVRSCGGWHSYKAAGRVNHKNSSGRRRPYVDAPDQCFHQPKHVACTSTDPQRLEHLLVLISTLFGTSSGITFFWLGTMRMHKGPTWYLP